MRTSAVEGIIRPSERTPLREEVPAPGPRTPAAADQLSTSPPAARSPEAPRLELVAPAPSRPASTPPAPPAALALSGSLYVDQLTGLPLMPPGPGDYSEDGEIFHRRPENAAELRLAYQALARAIEGRGADNLFARTSSRQRAAMVEQLEAAALGRGVAAVEARDRDDVQSRALRASVASVLHELIEALAADPSDASRAILARAVRAAGRQGEDETFPPLRRAMSVGLQRLDGLLPASMSRMIAGVVAESAPGAPPYDAWLADGKIVADVVVDGDALTEAQLRGMLIGLGFRQVPGTTRFERAVEHGGTRGVFQVNVRTDAAGIFDRVADPQVDLLAYFGHADYGRALPAALARVPAGTRGADKVFLSFSCFSKDNFHDVSARLPDLQVVGSQSFGNTLMAHGVLSAMFEGILERQSWLQIQRSLDEADHGNWISPAQPSRVRRLLDTDGDGRADVLDRTFDVEPERPRVPHLVGVASWLNRGASTYNEAINQRNPSSHVVADGTFEGDDDAPVVRFTPIRLPNGEAALAMQLNVKHAQMSPEVLRLAAAYELNIHLALSDPEFAYHGDPLRSRVNGLMVAAFTLSRSSGPNDEAAWQSFLRANGLPRVSLGEIQSSSGYGDFRAGNKEAVEAFIARLQRERPELAERLARAPEDPDSPRAPARRSGLPDALFAAAGARATHGHRVGRFYCIHSFFRAQDAAYRQGSSVVRNREGEPLVGFLHVPHDAISSDASATYRHEERFAGLRAVAGRGLAGYVRNAAARVSDGPIRVLHTGFGEWFSAPNNPSGHFVRHPENIDAAMRAGLGDALVEIGPRRAHGPGTVHTYRVRIGDRLRDVEVLAQELPVSDEALSEDHPRSLMTAMRSFRPHAALLTGVAGSEFRAEWRATDDNLDTSTWRNVIGREPTRILPDNFSLARVLRGRPGPR